MSKLNLGNDLYLKGRIGWKGLSKEEYLENGHYKIINATSLMDGYVDWSNCGYITKERYNDSEDIKLRENDILISKDGTLGKIGYVKELETPTTVASGIFVLRNTKPDMVDFDYLYHLLKSHIFKDFINKNKALGSTINHLYQRDLANFELELPDLYVQKKIAEIFNTIDYKIACNNKITQELEDMVQTIFNYWFMQFDFPDKDGKPYKTSGGRMVYDEKAGREIPEGWQVVNMEDWIMVRDGTHDSPKAKDKGFHLITSKHLKEWGIDFENANLISEEDYELANKRSRVDTGDILFSMIGNIGTVYKVEIEKVEFAIKNMALYKTSKKKEYKNYVYIYLKSEYMNEYINRALVGSIQKFIGLGDLRNMPILINKDIISKYVEITSSMFEQMNTIMLENYELMQLRHFLLPLLMNGQVQVMDGLYEQDEEMSKMLAELRVAEEEVAATENK